MKGRTTKSGESWEDLNKRRGQLSAAARRRSRALRREIAQEERAEQIRITSGAADIRIMQALGPRYHLHVARIVLSALAEPTPEMIKAARTQIDDAGKWRAMVKAALRELDGIY